MTLTLTAPTGLTTAELPQRSRLIQELGAALRDDSTVLNLQGRMTGVVPRTVWMTFSFTNDHTPYRLTFPNTSASVTLWMRGLFRPWEPLATWTLTNYTAGANLWSTIRAYLDSPAMEVLHRWLEEPVPGGAR